MKKNWFQILSLALNVALLITRIGKGHGPVNHFYEPKALFIK